MNIGKLIFCIANPEKINLAGQLFSLVGTLMLFYFGLPKRLPAQGNILIWGESSPNEKKKDKREYLYQYIGLGLTLIGSILQMLVTYYSVK